MSRTNHVEFTNIQISSVRAKVDGSLGLSLSTGELTADQKAAMMGLMGLNLEMGLKVADEAPQEPLVIASEVERKTPSQRLRSVMFVYWSQTRQNHTEDFEEWYKGAIETIINAYKEKLT